MADNKLNLLVKFAGVDKLSGSIKNIVGASKGGAAALKELRGQATDGKKAIKTLNGEIKENGKELERVRAQLASGSMKSGLAMAERELVAAIDEANGKIREQEQALERTNRQIDQQKKKMERVAAVQTGFTTVGAGMSKAGTALSIGVTAPVTALAASIGNLAEKSRDMQNAAAVAGVGFEEFQRGAYAAQSVGMEYDKFGDILKDTQDKIGDFTGNEGGEMSDFFENVGKKVGVTAKSFEGLSGADALQLYYNTLVKANVSQAEMVTYMESVADEGSRLMPILANNGEKMRELGASANVLSQTDAQGLQRYNDSMQELGNAAQGVQIALAKSGLIDAMVWLADKGTEAAEWFGTLSPAAQKLSVGIGLVLAVAGPLLVGLGMVVSAASTLAPILVGIAGVIAGIPLLIGLAVAAFVALGVAIYANWDSIVAGVQSGWETVKSYFSSMPEWMQNIGSMMMTGLLAAINPLALGAKLISMAKNGITAFKDYLGIHSPSRLMMEMGGHITDGLGMGVDQGAGRAQQSMRSLAGGMVGAGARQLAPSAPRPRQAAAPAQYHFHIKQAAGEDSESLARRIAELLEKAKRQKRLRSQEDDY